MVGHCAHPDGSRDTALPSPNGAGMIFPAPTALLSPSSSMTARKHAPVRTRKLRRPNRLPLEPYSPLNHFEHTSFLTYKLVQITTSLSFKNCFPAKIHMSFVFVLNITNLLFGFCFISCRHPQYPGSGDRSGPAAHFPPWRTLAHQVSPSGCRHSGG